jgi:hemerythrin superfamily protein
MGLTRERDQDVVDLLLDQHSQIKSLFQRVSLARGDHRRDLFEDLVRLLAVHESAEEQVVHPRARAQVGDAVVEERLHEEDLAKQAVAELWDRGVTDPEFGDRLVVLAQAVIDHAVHEETAEFPVLRQNLSDGQLRRMAGAVRAAEAVAPTRPHPRAGESATANLLTGPPLAVFDRTRDAVRDWRRSNDEG